MVQAHTLRSNEALAEGERRSKAEVEKASAGVRGAKREYIRDIEAFARCSYQEKVPFLARNFGTFGVHFGYDLFDGGKSGPHFGSVTSSWHKPKKIRLESATKSKYECKLPITSWSARSRWSRFSQELLATRQEARRVSAQ